MMRNILTKDAVIVFFLIAAMTVFALCCVNFSIAPYEDAAMVMRYAEHFAQGHGIVWNIGDKPVDGATDFLFMIVIGLFVRFGTTVEFATRFVGFLSHALSVGVIYLTARKLFHVHKIYSIIASLCFIVGPGLYYVAAYFGTPFFALFILLSWCLALVIIVKGATRKKSLLFGFASLISGLIRPEGVILTSLMLVSIVYIKGMKNSRVAIATFLGVFMVLGGAYFLWRWNYFGFALPNPFYKKGGSIHLESFTHSIGNSIRLCLPFLPAFLLGLYEKKTVRLTIGLLIPIVGFISAFALISDEMNYGARFQYVVFPMVLLSLWPLIEPFKNDLHFPQWNSFDTRKKTVLSVMAAFVFAGVIGYEYKAGKTGYFRDGRYDVARMLSDYQGKNLRMATSEAGLLPLYSKWKALDTWGLNDQWIAHHGQITDEYLSQFQPHVIMFKANSSPVDTLERIDPEKITYGNHVRILKLFAEKNHYILAAAFGVSPFTTHYYYVKPGFEESSEIVRRIQSTGYFWYLSGEKSINYASFVSRKEK